MDAKTKGAWLVHHTLKLQQITGVHDFNGRLGAAFLNRALFARVPLVLFWIPSQGRYSPLWDVHPAAWSAAAVASGQNVRQTEFGQILNLAQKGIITGPGRSPFGPAGFVVNCPIVSRD